MKPKQPKPYKELLKAKSSKLVEECFLCRKEIYIKKDDFVQVIDFKHGRTFMEGFYHTKCYLDRINKNSKTTELQTKAENLLNKAMKMMGEEKPIKDYYVKRSDA